MLSCKRPCFSSQEVAFDTLTDGLSCFNMWPWGNALVYGGTMPCKTVEET